LIDDSVRIERKVTTHLPAEYVFLSVSRNRQALDALFEREISVEDIYKWKIGFCKSGKHWERLVFPSFNANGICNYYATRAVSPKQTVPYLIPDDVSKNDIIFNELNIDWNEVVKLTEGVPDAIKIGDNVIPLMGKSLADDSEVLRKLCIYDPTVWICLDTDRTKKGYVNRSIKLAEKLLSYGLTDIWIIDPFPFKDFGEIPKILIPEFMENKKKINSKFDLLFLELEQMENSL